jgi:isopropylmalate/homocitrate/citramalate synthase
MTRALLALALIACSDPDPHAIAACDGWTNNDGTPFTGQCEAACASPPEVSGNVCDTTQQLKCNKIEFGNSDGCCIPDQGNIVFFECAK